MSSEFSRPGNGEEDQEGGPGAHSSLLTCSFNQDGGCLAIGTTSGFSVHNLHPSYAVSVKRELQGGIGLVEMLFRCNLMALVGGGPSPQAPPHRVVSRKRKVSVHHCLIFKWTNYVYYRTIFCRAPILTLCCVLCAIFSLSGTIICRKVSFFLFKFGGSLYRMIF